MGEKKSIKISLGTAICIFIIIILIIAMIGMWFVHNKNNANNLGAEIDTNKNVENEVEEYKEWADIQRGYKLKYPRDWNLILPNDYMEATILEGPGKNKDNAAKLYVTVYRYFENSTISDVLEEITESEEGVQAEELHSEEKHINISGLDTEAKVQVITYDNGDEYKTKTLVCMNDSIVYEFVYTGEPEEYEKYYKEFEEILESVEIYDINSNEVSEFEQVYTALTNYLTENKTELIESNNKIEEVAVTEIEIFDDKYFLGNKFNSEEYPDVYNDENLLIGSCKYAMKIPNQEGLELAGSGDMETIGDWIIITKLFIIEKDTNKVELCTGF
ncbi:MAG: hypothetical protein IJN50_05910 [Clostridia bacterium]|nr:hypothetical protein [Clostridia bacterium]